MIIYIYIFFFLGGGGGELALGGSKLAWAGGAQGFLPLFKTLLIFMGAYYDMIVHSHRYHSSFIVHSC